MSEHRTPSQRRHDREFEVLCADAKVKYDKLWEAYFDRDHVAGETPKQWMDRKLTDEFQSSEICDILRGRSS